MRSQPAACQLFRRPARATAKDVLQLIDVVRNRVAERMGVELETEIEIW